MSKAHIGTVILAIHESDYAANPPGDGTGSESLLRMLQAHRKFDVPPEEFLKPGALRFHYRRPGLHNPKSFDLWCDGVNNWEK